MTTPDSRSASELDVTDVSPFSDEGVMTMNAGLVVRLADGSVFQLTVVRAR